MRRVLNVRASWELISTSRYVDVLFKPNSNLVGSVGNCLHELAASGANWKASTWSTVGARSSQLRMECKRTATNRQSQLRGRVWGTRDAVEAKEVSRNCSQVFEALQFASFQTEYEYENPIQEKPANTLIPPNEHKENAKAISWNRLGKYILFLMWHVFLSVLCDWAT